MATVAFRTMNAALRTRLERCNISVCSNPCMDVKVSLQAKQLRNAWLIHVAMTAQLKLSPLPTMLSCIAARACGRVDSIVFATDGLCSSGK